MGVTDARRRKDLASATKAMPGGVLEVVTLTGKTDDCAERPKDYRKARLDPPIIMLIGDVTAEIRKYAP